jgi:hypothetical protein
MSSDSASKYRYWDVLDELPQGWVIDKTCGSPLTSAVFITNGKSVLNGQKRALLKVEAKRDISTKTNDIAKPRIVKVDKPMEETARPIFPAKTVNDLARLKFQHQILKEIMFDLMVCEIEEWDKKQYLDELKKLLNGFDITSIEDKK